MCHWLRHITRSESTGTRAGGAADLMMSLGNKVVQGAVGGEWKEIA